MPFCIFTEMRNFVSANICKFSNIFALSFKHFNVRENQKILFVFAKILREKRKLFCKKSKAFSNCLAHLLRFMNSRKFPKNK